MSKKKNIEIIRAIVVAVLAAGSVGYFAFLSNNTMQTGSLNNNASVSSSGINQMMTGSPNSQQTVSIDQPAQYSARYEIGKNTDPNTDSSAWPYVAIVAIKADKKTNLPQHLCLKINSDVVTHPKMNPISNVGQSIASVTVGVDGYVCIQSPSENLIARFLLSQKPKVFQIELNS